MAAAKLSAFLTTLLILFIKVRMMNRNIAIILLLGVLFAACKHPVRGDASEFLYVGDKKSVADTSIMKRLSTFSFEDTPNSLLSMVDRVLKFDGHYYLLDKSMNQVLIFDCSGKYIRTINKIGNGVGEYSKLRDIAIDKIEKKLLMLVQPSSILFYNLDGAYDKTLRLDGYHNGLSVDSQYIYISNSSYVNNKLSEFSLTVITKDGEEVKKVLKPLQETSPYCYSQGVPISATNTVYYTRRFDNTIYGLTGTEVNSLYSINWVDHSFPEDLKEQTLECEDLNKVCRANEYIYAITDVQESGNALLFRTNLSGLYLLSKEDKSVKHYNMIMNTECNMPLPNYIPVGGEGNEVFFIYPAHMLSTLKKRLPEDVSSNEVGRLINSLGEESNPLIFRYELR